MSPSDVGSGRGAGRVRFGCGAVTLHAGLSRDRCVAYAPRMRTRLGRSLALLPTLGLLLLTVAATPVAAQDDCTLTVKPKNGSPGTEFVFSGSGYAPTRIVLKQPGGPTKTVSVTPGDADTFTIRLVAGQGDTGSWTRHGDRAGRLPRVRELQRRAAAHGHRG